MLYLKNMRHFKTGKEIEIRESGNRLQCLIKVPEKTVTRSFRLNKKKSGDATA